MKSRSMLRSAAVFAVAALCLYAFKLWRQNYVFEKIVERLSADSRAAEVVVSAVNKDSVSGEERTTIKFVEYDTEGKPLTPRYFTFASNIIQFEAMVIRFDDFLVRKGDRLKGKSAFLFLKAFSLYGPSFQQFEINKALEIPTGYMTDSGSAFERALWKKFWVYALGTHSGSAGVKNAQFEAPGTKFLPGWIYTIRIEHDGGLRVDSTPVPPIIRGENIPS